MLHAYLVESRRSTYIVTFDATSRLQLFRSPDLKVPPLNHPLFQVFQRRFLEKVQLALPDANIRAINIRDLMRDVRKYAGHLVNVGKSRAVLSTCSDMAIAVQGQALSINRLFDIRGKFLGYGPRPGFDSLDAQLGQLARKLSRREIVIVEDGAFTGKTLCFVLRSLEKAGLKVSKVVVGFCCSRAQGALKQAFDGELVVMDKIQNLVDWLPDNDLVPFVPRCGRVFGARAPTGFMPVQTPDCLSYAFPYILPFGNFEEWASLPAQGALDLSKFCLETGIEIFGCIAKRTGHPISIRDLVRRDAGVLMPITVGSKDIPSIDTDVVAFLKAKREMLG